MKSECKREVWPTAGVAQTDRYDRYEQAHLLPTFPGSLGFQAESRPRRRFLEGLHGGCVGSCSKALRVFTNKHRTPG